MTWQQILKQPQLSMGDVGLINLDNVPDEKKDCCETARKGIINVYNMSIERYEREGRYDKMKSMEQNISLIEKAECEHLKWLAEKLAAAEHTDLSFAPAGFKMNPEILELKRIYEEWKECESS